ncbi:MAG: translation initiation factor [Verrucomicrobiales bacterium]|nr:translation initiation factor [Verrucomicrobiales bacterium]
MSKKKNRRSKEQGGNELPTPFSALNELSGLPEGSLEPPRPTSRRDRKNTTRGRLNITREFAHRGGKIVTVVSNFQGISQEEKQALAKKIQKSHGVGGTVKDGRIEIRGDLREEIKVILEEAGFQPKFAGG